MKYFVSSDIHGFYDLWVNALSEKGLDINNPEHKIIVCGDLFDRGAQPKKIIDFILSNREKFILIRGNHEDLMEDMILRNCSLGADVVNGTAQTIVDLCPEWQVTRFDLDKIAKHTGLQEVLNMCQDYYETEHYIFVHSWIPTFEDTYLYDKDWRNASKRDWEIARWKNPVEMFNQKIFEPNKTIVCGHRGCNRFWKQEFKEEYRNTKKENYDPFITNEMIAIDAYTLASKKVNVIILED